MDKERLLQLYTELSEELLFHMDQEFACGEASVAHFNKEHEDRLKEFKEVLYAVLPTH
jgi:hypothetical protein